MATLAELWDETPAPAAKPKLAVVQPSDMRVSPALQKKRDQDALRITEQEYKDNPNDAALKSDLDAKRKALGVTVLEAPAQQTGTLAELWDSTPAATAPVPTEPAKVAPFVAASETSGVAANPMIMRQGQRIREQNAALRTEPKETNIGQMAKNLGTSTAALFDTATQMITGPAQQLTYAAVRPFVSADRAKQISTLPAGVQRPLGTLFGVTESPAYTGEASTATMQFIGENVGKGAEWIANKTGLPVSDVENMIGTLTLAVPGAVKSAIAPIKGAAEAIGTVKQQVGEQFAARRAAQAGEVVAPTAEVPATGRVSIGAAATDRANAVRAEIAKATPEMQELLKDLPIEKFTDEHLKALETHNQFAKFGMKPTEGEALQNPSMMSRETNDRVKDPRLQARFEERDPKLIEGFETIKQTVAPDVYETDPVRMSNMALEKMKADLVNHEQSIRNAYDTANNATGTGQSAIDVAGLKNNIDEALKKKGKTKYLPNELKTDLDEALAKGYLTPEEYENFRTDTATIARTNQNPLARQAASIVREQLENVPLKGEFAKYKPLYDQARKLVVELKEKEKIPAYKAAASDTRTPEEIDAGIPHPAANTFMEKHYGEKTPEVNIKRMLNIIGENSPEHQALNAAKIDQFKLRSGIKNNEGKVSQATLNKIIFETHKSNLPTMFGNMAVKDLQDLADVARKTEHVKGVHSVNVSNTELIREQNAAMKVAKEVGQTLAEGGLAVATKGASTVVLPALKKAFKNKQEAAALAKETAEKSAESERRLSPTAGIKIKDMLP